MPLRNNILEILKTKHKRSGGKQGVSMYNLMQSLGKGRIEIRKELGKLYKEEKIKIYETINHPTFAIKGKDKRLRRGLPKQTK